MPVFEDRSAEEEICNSTLFWSKFWEGMTSKGPDAGSQTCSGKAEK